MLIIDMILQQIKQRGKNRWHPTSSIHHIWSDISHLKSAETFVANVALVAVTTTPLEVFHLLVPRTNHNRGRLSVPSLSLFFCIISLVRRRNAISNAGIFLKLLTEFGS